MTRPFSLGAWRVEVGQSRLVKGERQVHIHPKAMRVLAYLAERPQELVLKDHIIEAIWEDTFVSDEVLANAVWELRRALGDDAKTPQFIQTVSRKGYRLVAPVRWTSDERNEEANEGSLEPELVRGRSRRWVFASTFALLAIAGAWLYLHRSRSARIDSIAVLPFENLSGDLEQEYFADGMTTELISQIAQIRSLRVISKTSIMPYKGLRKPLREIAQEVDVDVIVSGTVRRDGGRVRITAQLVDVGTDRVLWAQSFERELRDVLSLQSDFARSAAGAVEATLTPEEKLRFATTREVDPAAHDAYLRGSHHLGRLRSRISRRASTIWSRRFASILTMGRPMERWRSSIRSCPICIWLRRRRGLAKRKGSR